MNLVPTSISFFFLNPPSTTKIYTLSLHDALPICSGGVATFRRKSKLFAACIHDESTLLASDRKSTRLNSSHTVISYAVFCLKKKNGVFRRRNLRKLVNARSIDSFTEVLSIGSVGN